MATYSITVQAHGVGFDDQIVGAEGVKQTMLGFETEAAAAAWIAEDKRAGVSDRPSGFRMQWRF